MFPFYTPLKTLENQMFSSIFSGYKMGGNIGRKWVKEIKQINNLLFPYGFP